MNKKNRNILLILLFIAILICVIYFFFLKKNEKPIPFKLQGQTEIGAGKLILKVWDDNAEDGDTVAVYFNGKLIKDTLAILNVPDSFLLGNIEKGIYEIGIKAINEGTVSPASAAIAVSNGTEERIFDMDATLDSAASWRLIVK
jgi:hypothetical protein